LQAVQAIKNDPRTATIPIMMYTSQEGELYLGQARALGAVGVLPKQIKPAYVSKVLYQLHLVPDRRSGEQSTFTPLNMQVDGLASGAPGMMAKALTDTTLREHFAELRRALVASLDTQTDRITGEVRALLLEALPPPEPGAPPPGTVRAPWPWIVACAALAIALVSSALWWRSVNLLEGLRVELTQLQTAQTQARALQEAASQAAAAAAAPAAAPEAPRPAPDLKPTVIPVPYGAEALGGARLDTIRQVLYRLARQQKAVGVVDIRSFAGRFCLVGSALEGYSLAPEETPFARCDVVGNPSDEALSPAQRTPLVLANLIAEIRSTTHGTLDPQVSVGDPASVLTPYPAASGDLTAGEWNRAASANNRVEIRLR